MPLNYPESFANQPISDLHLIFALVARSAASEKVKIWICISFHLSFIECYKIAWVHLGFWEILRNFWTQSIVQIQILAVGYRVNEILGESEKEKFLQVLREVIEWGDSDENIADIIERILMHHWFLIFCRNLANKLWHWIFLEYFWSLFLKAQKARSVFFYLQQRLHSKRFRF